jgi:hypothetical protein
MKKVVGSLVAILAVTFGASTAFSAGDLVFGATVTDVSVRNNGSAEAFSMTTSGGTGPCVGATMNFPSTGSDSTDDGMRSIALAAFLSGKPVRVHDYAGTVSCAHAQYIRIQN